jgi:hypothetical protein
VLYLDASGDSGKYRGNNTQFFVLGGIACNPIISRDCTKEFRELIVKYFPDPSKRPHKIRYYDLIHNKYPWNLIDTKSFADEFCEHIVSHDVTVFSMIIDKQAHWEQYVNPIEPYNLTLDMMMNRYQWFLARHNDVGFVVSDREDPNLMQKLSELFERFKENGTAYQKLTNIIDTIFFARSDTCPILQATDFWAYAVFSKYEHSKLDRYNEIKSKLDPYGENKLPR